MLMAKSWRILELGLGGARPGKAPCAGLDLAQAGGNRLPMLIIRRARGQAASRGRMAARPPGGTVIASFGNSAARRVKP
jgi:hypothetical protein